MTQELSQTATQQLVQAMIKLYPQTQSELNFDNHFQLLCAVVLSAQTTDKAVNLVTPALFAAYPDPQSMALAEPEDLAEYIKTIGLYRNKSKFLVKLSQQLLDRFDGQVPNTREDLMSLSGVGRKTANVVLYNAFNQPSFAVDTHVHRVCRKFAMVAEDANVNQVEETMMEKLPPEMWGQAHHSILLFGRYQCVARKHNHDECIARLEAVLKDLD